MINVVIADDSALLRQVLQEVLESTKKIKVVGVAKNGKEAIELVQRLSPDVLILDCEMPVMTGLAALRVIMNECPLPVFMFSSLTQEGASVTLMALEYGAVDFLPKPTRGPHELDTIASQLIRKIETVALRGRFRKSKPEVAVKEDIKKKEADTYSLSKEDIDIIAVGSSTGGVQAAVELIKGLPEKTKPIVWVQHMPESFTKSFSQRLDGLAKISVKEAEDGDKLLDSNCYIARGGIQMKVVKNAGGAYSLKLAGEEKVSGHCPSCDYLFDSVAEHFSKNALGVILTGMGDDGTKGLLKMHSQGSYVIGQNKESCVVYGMPKAAYEAGAVDLEVDISEVSKCIIKKGGAVI